ncbi:MAG: methyltransferase domain-containing protein [Planctomycetia bacterium]|nr:methyltransferase domain-containing protein [Planctomycetia bacterium]
MSSLFGLRDRLLEPEDMDDPALATERLHGALSGLTRLNFVSNSARIVWRPIRQLAGELKTSQLRILDIATGAGDVPIALLKRVQRSCLSLDIHGIDFSPRSIEFARHRAEQAKIRLTFECRNALADDLPSDFDAVMCSLFLHHLTSEDALKLLRRMAAAARHLVLINDLRRSPYGLALAYLASRVLTSCDVVHVDAVRSVRAAFTADELRQMADEAGLAGATIARRWPARMLLEWGRHLACRD